MSGSVKGEKCGYCGGKFPATETPTDYFKECDLCKKTFYLKRNCAKKMLAKQQKISTSEINLLPEEFKNMNIKLLCKNCQQQECFHCGLHHTDNDKEVCSVCKKVWCFVLQVTNRSKLSKSKKKLRECQKNGRKPGVCSSCKEKKTKKK